MDYKPSTTMVNYINFFADFSSSVAKHLDVINHVCVIKSVIVIMIIHIVVISAEK